MGKPAARLGDMTMHGGAIVLGHPTVLIGGMPAARMGDMHVCPLVTGVVPHVGGPVILGSPMVLIGGMPAARMGDMLVCVGPPDTIALGCMTVLIGEGGSGSASGGGAGSSGAAAATASAATALTDNNETSTKIEHWVEFEFVDKAGNPVSGLPYKFTAPDGKESKGVLRLDGKIRRDAMSDGDARVVLLNVCKATWSKNMAKVGEKVQLRAETGGFNDGTPAICQIWRRDITGPDVMVDELMTKVDGAKLKAEWEFKLPVGDANDMKATDTSPKYSSPEYYFDVVVGHCRTRSGLLYFEDYLEIQLKDESGKPVANEEYILTLPDGRIRKGKVDGQGKKKEEKIPSGACILSLPKLSAKKGSNA